MRAASSASRNSDCLRARRKRARVSSAARAVTAARTAARANFLEGTTNEERNNSVIKAHRDRKDGRKDDLTQEGKEKLQKSADFQAFKTEIEAIPRHDHLKI